MTTPSPFIGQPSHLRLRHPVRRRIPLGAAAVAALVLSSAVGCGGTPGKTPVLPIDEGEAVPCSGIHRALSRWQQTESPQCGPDITGKLELTPVGNHQLLVRRRFSAPYDVWTVTPEGRIGAQPSSVGVVDGGPVSSFTLVPGNPPRVLVSDPRSSSWGLYRFTLNGFSTPVEGSWPVGPVFASNNGAPWGRHFTGLAEGLLLDHNPGDGSSRLWRFLPPTGAEGTGTVELLPGRVGAPRDAFQRGHRLVPLGPGRLLEWLPRPCAAAGDDNAGNGMAGLDLGACQGADFRVWRYFVDADPGAEGGDLFAAEPDFAGSWGEIGAGNDIVADDSHLFVWTRATGRLRSYAIVPDAADPLGTPVLDDLESKQLASEEWRPPTQSPAIQHLVLILQDGRSFDSYFGQFCSGPPHLGSAPEICSGGAACCEHMPSSVPGAASCAPLDPERDSHRPVATPDCLRTKLHGGAMDGFALTTGPGACGDPLDFSCAGVGSAAGALGTYQSWAVRGALADRFFQSSAFADGDGAFFAADAALQNLLYLVTARFSNPSMLRGTPLLTKELARLEVPWAVYAGTTTLARMQSNGVPVFHDPDWYPFRSLEGGELERDLATAQLPPVSVVVPDGADPARSEAPGHPFDRAIAFVDGLATAIASSPTYGNNTLVLLTYTSAGGFYDHVPPPAPPPLARDASSPDAAPGSSVHYGPRVPLLVFPPFARSGQVSHVELEMSSITVFIEWNWMHQSPLYLGPTMGDVRFYRDGTANNLGSLIDPVAAGIPVPVHRD